MTQRGRGRKRVPFIEGCPDCERERAECPSHTFETTLEGPIVGFEWIAPETSKMNAGDRVKVTVELLARTRKG